jgi:branched-subunit amino acid transport protein
MSYSMLVLTILGMAAVTYFTRVFFMVLLGKVYVPAILERALRYVPAAALSALVIPALFYRQGALDVSVGNERLLSGLLAIVIAWYSGNVLVTIGLGMAALWLLQALG